jgi:hypothetical protein
MADKITDNVLGRPNQKLWRITAAFGGKVVLVTERDLAAEEVVMDDKAKFEQVEMK